MEVNRNHYFLIGLILIGIGIQLRMVDTYTLTPELTQFLAERTGHPLAAVNASTSWFTPSAKPLAKRVIDLPDWSGWGVLALGSVLALHAMSLRKPEG